MPTWFYYLICIVGGLAMTLQSSTNNFVSKAVNPEFSVFFNFVVAIFVVGVYWLIVKTPVSLQTIKTIPWWGFLGGFYSAVIVAVITIAPGKIGIGLTFAIAICVQIISAIIFDHFALMKVAQSSVSIWKILGALMLIAGAYLVSK